MLVKRVVDYLVQTLKCEEKVVNTARPYRKFKLSTSDEFLFVTDEMLFIGSSFNNCRPALSILSKACSSAIK